MRPHAGEDYFPLLIARDELGAISGCYRLRRLLNRMRAVAHVSEIATAGTVDENSGTAIGQVAVPLSYPLAVALTVSAVGCLICAGSCPVDILPQN